VINSEVCYEGIGEACRSELQRFLFWSCMLSGTAGHTYGANGIWQVNEPGKPYGPSPHGLSYGSTPWTEAAQYPGSTHVGLGKALLERYRWWEFQPHPEWVDPHWTEENYFAPFAAGIPGHVRVIYWPASFTAGWIKGVEAGGNYTAYMFDPITGDDHDLGPVQPEAGGDWKLPVGNDPWHVMPIWQDWVTVLETAGARQ
jgi:hypothetical protein